MTAEDIRAGLLARQDTGYRDFHSKLVPTLDKDTIIGIRTPILRAYAKELAKQDVSAFLEDLPHRYYDENCLHAFLIEQIKDFDQCMAALERFLPCIDNWATCDLLAPKVFKKHPDAVYAACLRWLESDHTYTVRFGVVTLMKWFLDADFRPELLEKAAALRTEEYYINMAVAWLFAEALAKQYDAALPYILDHRLDTWTHNKAIQKAVESRRISDETKAYLKTLKRKERK